MTQPNLNLSALIGSRICHDLISPVGAIANGLELMGLAGVPNGPEMSLVADSAANANARLCFFRIAFGVSSEGQSLSAREIRCVLKGVYTAKVTCDWQIEEPLPRKLAQAVFLAILCAEQAIPHGGEVLIDGGPQLVSVTATGPRCAPVRDHWQWLTALESGDLHQLPAAQVQFALLPNLLAELGRIPTIDLEEGVRLAF